MTTEDIFFTLLLTLVPGIGDVHGRALIDRFGTATALFKYSYKDLLAMDVVKAKVEAICMAYKDRELISKCEKEIHFIEEYQIKVYIYGLPGYPVRLNDKHGAPVILFAKGSADLNTKRIVSIIGTRKPTSYGLKLCSSLVEAFAGTDLMVVSGLAHGIDVCAHRTSIKAGLSTVAVLGHGLNSIYPRRHRSIAVEMIENGSLVSEFLSGTGSKSTFFPRRNRVIAGMCDACIIVEAGAKSGTLNTALVAGGYNIPLMVFPGRLTDDSFAGCLNLIYTNKAQMIRSHFDVLDQLNWNMTDQNKTGSGSAKIKQKAEYSSASEKRLHQFIILYGDPTLDEILEEFKNGAEGIPTALISLEMQGVIRSIPGSRFENAM